MLYLKKIFYTWILISYMLFFSSRTVAQSFTLSGVGDLVQVFEDGYHLPVKNEAVMLYGIRGEVISGQLVIHAVKDLNNVQVELSDLHSGTDGNLIPVSAIEWNFVGSIPLIENAPNQPPDALVRKAPARFPDYLMAERKIDIPRKIYRAIWLTVSIPESAPSGDFSGIIKIS